MAISDRIPNSKATVGATRRISAITIGVRTRRDLGDIAGLATSIVKIRLLHPITVDENGRLLAGARRLAACKCRQRRSSTWPSSLPSQRQAIADRESPDHA